MTSKRTKFSVGLFMTGGICIALLAFIWLGMSRFLEKGHYYTTYFNESVQGLDKDSPVKYRGVSIGRVDSIQVAPDSKLIQVVMKIDTGQELTDDMVAQLKSVGITGIMFIELDRKKKDEIDRSPILTFPSKYPIIASKPSNISQLLQGIDYLLNQIRALDLEGISGKIKITLDSINQSITDADIKKISGHVISSIEDVKQIFDRNRWDNIIASIEDSGKSFNSVMIKADEIMGPLEDVVHSLNSIMSKADLSLVHLQNSLAGVEKITVENMDTIEKAIQDFKQSMEKVNLLLEEGSSLVGGADDSLSRLSRYLMAIAQNLERASENLNRFTDLIADEPSKLIFGEPPAPRKLEEK